MIFAPARRAGGNPLFVVNVADDLVRRAVLVERDGLWEVAERHDLANIAIPDDVRRMIRARARPRESR